MRSAVKDALRRWPKVYGAALGVRNGMRSVAQAGQRGVWIAARPAAIRRYLAEHDVPKLQIGVGPLPRPGWLNSDLILCSMLEDGAAPASVGTEWECRLRIDSLPLRPRLYNVYASVSEATGAQLMDWLEVTNFRVGAPASAGPAAIAHATLGGPIDVSYNWDIC